MKSNVRAKGVRRAFTLIELLIVVAIIAILALIAVPNFLEAQVRAKVSRAMTDMRSVHVAIGAYQVDWNAVIWDANDTWTPEWQDYEKSGYNFAKENPGVVPDVVFRGDVDSMQSFYCFAHFRPLTSPVAYITFRPRDSFSKVVPMGIDTREVNRSIVYWVLLSAGPDRTEGDWYRGNNPETRSIEHPDGTAIKYDPSNGTVSKGDIWRGESYADTNYYKREYVYPL